MAVIVFLRGVNVGGHRTFRPSILARELRGYDVVNIGAAGTFIVRKPPSRAKLRAELRRKLPFEAEVVLCGSGDLIRLEAKNPFSAEPPSPDVVRFVSILSKAGGVRAPLPVRFPSDGEWLVRVMASEGQFVFGMYRRHMKTIGLGAGGGTGAATGASAGGGNAATCPGGGSGGGLSNTTGANNGGASGFQYGSGGSGVRNSAGGTAGTPAGGSNAAAAPYLPGVAGGGGYGAATTAGAGGAGTNCAGGGGGGTAENGNAAGAGGAGGNGFAYFVEHH